MIFSLADHQHMQRALLLAKQGYFTTSPNPRVGCVLVNNGMVVGEGFHEKAGASHAEVNALAQAKALASGATAYVTLEPCSHFGRTPPCAQALIDAGVTQVIAAMVDPNPNVSGKGLALLEQAGIRCGVGLLEQQARALNPGFINLMTTGKPYVRCKMAASLDGKTAMASGESQWITSAQARRDVQRLRAQSCAIICGADSVIWDQAKMTVRWEELGALNEHYPPENLRQPLRVVIDSQNRLTPELALFQHHFPIVIVNGGIENNQSWPHFVEQVRLPVVKNPAGIDKIDLNALLAFLAKRGLNEVLIESGATLAGAFVEQNLVDELILYQAPTLIGADGKSLLAMPGITRLSAAKTLTIDSITMVGPDIRIVAKFAANKNESKACLQE